MKFSAQVATLEQIRPWRDLYRQEMNCQIVHDSLHPRQGWTTEYFLLADGVVAGYGSVVQGGPWTGKPAVFEFYVAPPFRSYVFELFRTLLATSRPVTIDVQTNDPLLTVMYHSFARHTLTEKILFRDGVTTNLPSQGGSFRPASDRDRDRLAEQQRDSGAQWVLEFDGNLAATGGILYHYNRPYGDIFMEVAEPFRRRGFGSYLVQELKRACYEGGSVPAARCNLTNIASRGTLHRAGFIPCANIVIGEIDYTLVNSNDT
jgi:GNAT superfamily N-acetyltransferase